MKPNYSILISLLLLFSISSCKRFDGNTVVEGTVVDRSSGKAIPNAKVIVYSRNSRAMVGYNTKELEKQADGNGNFSFSFEGESEREYALFAKTELGHFTESLEATKLKEGRNNKNIKLRVHSPAWVRVILTNVPPKEKVSYLTMQSFSQENGSKAVIFYSLETDTIFIRGVEGGKNNIFLLEIKDKHGNILRSNPSAFFPALDTFDLAIDY